MKCRECKGLFSDNLMTEGLCRACTPNTPRYNANLTADEHDTLKAKAELLDELVDYAVDGHGAICSDQYNRLVSAKLKDIILRAKELT